jgi:hypothetical protein
MTSVFEKILVMPMTDNVIGKPNSDVITIDKRLIVIVPIPDFELPLFLLHFCFSVKAFDTYLYRKIIKMFDEMFDFL